MMISKGNKLYSIFSNKCPKCQSGDFWYSGNPYVNLLKHKGRMHNCCTVCGLLYEQEPGYFYGAMYVSYALGVALFVGAWIFNILIMPDDISILWEIAVIIAFLVLLAPVNYYLSRLIWINFFIPYRKGA